jgi:hypothetical protein
VLLHHRRRSSVGVDKRVPFPNPPHPFVLAIKIEGTSDYSAAIIGVLDGIKQSSSLRFFFGLDARNHAVDRIRSETRIYP